MLQQKLALAIKAEGNEFFKAGKYESTIDSYTRTIEIAPYISVSYSNRAMARLKLKRYKLAEADCTHCLEMDPYLIKAMFRRGLARKALNKYNEALEDFESVLAVDPENKAAKKEITATGSLQMKLNSNDSTD